MDIEKDAPRAQGLLISAVRANANGQRGGLDVAASVGEALPHLPLYRLSPQPGDVRADAFQWLAVLDVAANLIEVGAFLWILAQQLVEKHEATNNTGTPFMVVFLSASGRNWRQLVVRSGESAKHELVGQLRGIAAELLGETPPEFATAESILRRLEDSGAWVRVRTYSSGADARSTNP